MLRNLKIVLNKESSLERLHNAITPIFTALQNAIIDSNMKDSPQRGFYIRN